MNEHNNIYNQQPQQIPMMSPPQMRPAPRNWKQRILSGNTGRPLTLQQERTLPNWLVGKSVIFFFIAFIACTVVFGHPMEMRYAIISSLSVLLFFYGSKSVINGAARYKEKAFLKNVFIVGLVARLLWVGYCYFFFNPDYYGTPWGESADVEWYMPFSAAIAEWIRGNNPISFGELMDRWMAAIDDVGYPFWLAIINILTFGESDVFVPFMIKTLVGAYCAICVKECRGKYICNCDNDDYWHNPHKLQLQLDYMESHPESNICITNHRTHNRTTGEIKEVAVTLDHNDIQMQCWNGGHFCNATIMYRADFMKAHLDLDEFIRRRFTLQDWPAWVILTAYTDIDLLPESTATFGIETVSITRPDTVERLAKRLDGDKDVCRYLGELFPDKFPYTDEMWERYAAGRLLAKAYDVGDYLSAKKYGKECRKYSIKAFSAKTWLTFQVYRMLKHIRVKLDQ